MDNALAELATLRQTSLAAVQSLVNDLGAQAGTESFYVFWTSPGTGQSTAGQRTRRLLAFTTPDAAFAFAQRNNLLDSSAKPRLRRLSLARLLLAMMRESSISMLLLVRDGDLPDTSGQLPNGVAVLRADVEQRLSE